MAVGKRANGSALKTLAAVLHTETLEVYIFGRAAKTEIPPLWLSLNLLTTGHWLRLIKSVSAREVFLEPLAQTLPTTVGDSVTVWGLPCVAACFGRRGHVWSPDFEGERNIGGNDQ